MQTILKILNLINLASSFMALQVATFAKIFLTFIANSAFIFSFYQNSITFLRGAQSLILILSKLYKFIVFFVLITNLLWQSLKKVRILIKKAITNLLRTEYLFRHSNFV